MINDMNQPPVTPENKESEKAPLSLWKSILLLILLAFVMVSLFGVMIYLFISGVQQMGLSAVAGVAIFVLISGVFAWLLKRVTDIVSGMGRRWFPEEEEWNE